MDDRTITDDRLREGLHGLRAINVWLGGHSALWTVVRPYLIARPDQITRILDVGTGLGDIPELLVRRAASLGRTVEITAIDTNPATIGYARDWLSGRLDERLRRRITLRTGDFFSFSEDAGPFHLCTASLFLHHLDDEQVGRALRLMDRLGNDGFVVNDLHRTAVAYYGLRLINRLMPVSDMVRHDGPLSVLRGFRRAELDRLARRAGCTDYSITWHWAFRWILSTIDP